jgi:L-asparaginase/Glu-tRNA(Gln) amidotransferase subunit D
MTIDFAADISTIMDTDEFAVSVTYDGGTVSAIFDNETLPVEGPGFVPIHQAQPRLTARTADFPSIAEDQALSIGSDNYKIKAWIDDGTGVMEIQLEKV